MLKKKELKNQPEIASSVLCPMCGTDRTASQGVIKDYIFKFCSNCEFIFCPEITPEYLSKQYANGFHGPDDGAPKNGWSGDGSFLDPAFDALPKKENLRILDFGTGQDDVPDRLRKKGHRTIAVDIAPPVRPHPDRLTGNLIELDLERNQFDLAFAFQVFEHLPEPRPLLKELLRLTRPGGVILIHTDMETPDREASRFEDWWYVAPPDHCSFYRNKTFKVFFKNTPHKVIYSDPTRVIVKKNALSA